MERHMATLVWVILLLHTGTKLCKAACLSIADGEVFSVGGDATITQLLPLHHGEHCDKISMTEVQILEATKLAVKRVNDLNLVPGVSIGLRVVDTCGEVSRSVKLALASLSSDARACQPTLSLGFLGPGDAASARAVGKATRALHTPVVAYGPRTTTVTDTLNFITPAPQRSAKAAVQVLAGLKVTSLSLVHTADEEGRCLAEHFNAAAADAYRCIEMVLEAGENEKAVAEILREGPGTVVILGTKEKAQSLARTIGAPGGPADLILLLDNAGPVPEVALDGVVAPVLMLQRAGPAFPEFFSYFERDLSASDSPRREYIAAIANCEFCKSLGTGYDASAPAAAASILAYAEALREAHIAKCGAELGICSGIKSLTYDDWQEILSQASIHSTASTVFPSLLDANLDPGSEDYPSYVIRLMANGTFGNITQVGHADETSAILGLMDEIRPRCGNQCPCLTNEIVTTTPAPEMLPAPDDITAPTKPPSGFNIWGKGSWWNDKGWTSKRSTPTTYLTKMQVATYMTAFTFVLVVFFSASMVCIYQLVKPPPRD